MSKGPVRPKSSIEFGSIPRGSIKPVVTGGIRRINGRQVNLLLALAIEAGFSEQKLLEFMEFNCGCKVDKLEDVPDGPKMQEIVAALKGEKVR